MSSNTQREADVLNLVDADVEAFFELAELHDDQGVLLAQEVIDGSYEHDQRLGFVD